MPITQEMLDKLDPVKKQRAMQLMQQLQQQGVDPHQAYDSGGMLPQATPQIQSKGILPQVMSGIGGMFRSQLPLDSQVKMAQINALNQKAESGDAQTEINNFLAKEQAKIKLQQMADEQDPAKQLARKKAQFELGLGGEEPNTTIPSVMPPVTKPSQVIDSGVQEYIVDPSKRTFDNPKGLVRNPEFYKQSEDANRKKQISEDVKASAQESLKTIAEIEKGMGYFGVGGLIPAIPGVQSEKVNWEANVNQLLSQRILDTMNKMKSASRTGATGFGQLSQKELKVLQDASTALKKTMSKKDAQRYINDMKVKLQKIASGSGINTNEPMDERSQAKQVLVDKGYSDEEAEQLLGQ